MAVQLRNVALEGHEVHQHILTESAKIIQKDAKDQLGTYQDPKGPFDGWVELADSTKQDRVSQGFTPNDPLLRSGQLRDSIQMGVESGRAVVGTNDEIAKYQEFGTGHIPPRPFLGPAAFMAKVPISVLALKTVVAWIAGLGWKRPSITLTGEDLSLKR